MDVVVAVCAISMSDAVDGVCACDTIVRCMCVDIEADAKDIVYVVVFIAAVVTSDAELRVVSDPVVKDTGRCFCAVAVVSEICFDDGVHDVIVASVAPDTENVCAAWGLLRLLLKLLL